MRDKLVNGVLDFARVLYGLVDGVHLGSAGPKKEMANVSILGPVRKMDQIELSATDARTLGIDAPVRESGDVKGSGACKLVGPKGEVELTEAVALKNPEQAETTIRRLHDRNHIGRWRADQTRRR